MGRERLIPWIRLGHSKFVQRIWILAFGLTLSLGIYLSQNWYIPIQLHSPQTQSFRWLCSPQLCSLKQGDTILDKQLKSYRILNTRLWTTGDTLHPSQMKLETFLETMNLWHTLPHWEQNRLSLRFQYQKPETISVSISGLHKKLPTSWDSLAKWKRKFDSTLDFKADLNLQLQLLNSKNLALSKIPIKQAWLEVMTLDGSQHKMVLALDSIKGSF